MTYCFLKKGNSISETIIKMYGCKIIYKVELITCPRHFLELQPYFFNYNDVEIDKMIGCTTTPNLFRNKTVRNAFYSRTFLFI